MASRQQYWKPTPMNRMFDFKCNGCGRVFEEMIQDDAHILPCEECGGTAVRQLAAPRLDWRHMGLDPAFSSAYDKWGKAKRKHSMTDKGTMHGGKAPNLLMH